MMRYIINENFILETLGNNGALLRDFYTENIYVLNKTSLFVVQNLDKNIDEIAILLFKGLSDNSGVSIDEIKLDVQAVINDLIHKDFIRLNNIIKLDKEIRYVNVKNLYIEIISLCNKKCIYCYNENFIQKKEFIEIENVEKLINQCDPNVLEGVMISGGEPLLHKDIEKLFVLCKKYKLKVAMISNASLIDNEKAKMLSKYNINIQFTIDGYTKELNDFTRDKDSFENQLKALELLKKNNFKGFLNIRTNLWRENTTYENIKGIIEICEKFDISRLDLVEVKKNDSFKNVLLEKDYEKVKTIINKLNTKVNVIYERDVEEFKCSLDVGLENIEFGLRISSSGDIYPCQYFLDKQFSIGNIYCDSLSNIIKGDKNKKILNLISLRKSFIEKCTSCIYGDKCNAGCPAKAYLNNKNIFTSDGSCNKRKLQFANYYVN